MSSILEQMSAKAPAVDAKPATPKVKRVVSGNDYKVTTRLIQLLGAEKSGKTVTAASLARNFPKTLPAKEMTTLKGMVYFQFDAAGIEALWALNLTPEFVIDLSTVTDSSALWTGISEAVAELGALGDAVDFIVLDSVSLMHTHIHNRHIKKANENAKSLAYPNMAVDHSSIWHVVAPLGKSVIALAHIKYVGLFMDSGNAKEQRENRLKAHGLPGSIMFTSNLPPEVGGFYTKTASATFIQRRIPGPNGRDRLSLLVRDGITYAAGSRWAPFLKETEYPCDLRAIMDAVEARCPAIGMAKDEHSISAEDLVSGKVAGFEKE